MKGVLALAVCLLGSAAFAQNPKEMSADAINRGQAMADAVLGASGADAAFFASGLVKEGAKGDLAAQCQYPTDEIMVLELTGAQIKLALERSVSLHPSPNPGFLYLAGIEATFKPKAAPDSRISDVTINGSALSATAKYKIAMPGSLARGGLGYFSVWDKKDINRTLTGVTVESIMKGKTPSAGSSRWHAA
jgi:2',3'-cyclic-nucleotide 2'-phosphodiesterase (5'-nucleotidase family)